MPVVEAHARTVRTAVPGALALLGLACSAPVDRVAERPSTVIVSYCCGDEALSPAHDMSAKHLVFLSLLTEDEVGERQGRLARSWEHSADYREWTYHLRTDVRWDDGVPVTAHDVAFTIDLMATFSDLDYGSSALESVTVHDDSTITIRSGHSRIYQAHLAIYPKHLLEDLDPANLAEWEFWRRPVGSGPYRLVRLEPETMMEFEANPDFALGKPRIERVILKFSQGAAVTELLAGEVDATEIDAASLPSLTGDPRFRSYHWSSPWASQAVYWNGDHPILGDARVRRAFTHAIDRRGLHSLLHLPEDLPIIDGPHTPGQYRRRELPDPLPYDPSRAAALLDSAGWRDADGDGIRDRGGQPLRFTALVRNVSGENTPGNLPAATFVQSELRKIGAQMELRPLDPSVVGPRLEAGDFDAVFHWVRFWEAAWLGLSHFGAPEPLGYDTPRVVELIEQATRTAVPAEEDRIYQELTEIFQRDLPITILYPFTGVNVAHRRLRGLSSPHRSDPVQVMEHLWLEDTQQ